MNEPIGATFIKRGKDEVRLLFSNRALADAERIMGKGIIGVLSGFNEGQSGISDLSILIQQGMEAARRYYREGGKRVTIQDAFDLLDDVGFSNVASPVFEAIGAVLSYDADQDQEEDDSPNE